MHDFTGSRSVTALHCKKRRLYKSCSFLEGLLPKRIKVGIKSGASSGYSLERHRLYVDFVGCRISKGNKSASQARIGGQDYYITL
jgi:hypothetical protein